jgi:hypothetical protein
MEVLSCAERGHYANQCPNLCARPPPTVVSTPTLTYGANSVPVATKKKYAPGRVNHIAVEEAQEAPDVVIGMFF